MFGQGNISSGWGQQQQTPQQQQQQGQPAFGQPANTNAFGSGGAFGSGSSFGQQQPQPQANPMFGGLGGTSNTGTAPASGFGAFGSTNTANTGTSLFGAPKPATGFGAFGGAGTGTFGGGAFGGGTTGTGAGAGAGTGLFNSGQQNTTTGTFGGGGLFGQKPATAFGTTSANPNAGPYDGVAPVTTGSSNPPYSSFNEKDNNVTIQYQSITCLPAYRGTSFEELRVQDYQQGRKTAGAYGQPPAYSTPAVQTGTGLFGQQPSTTAQPTNSLFGGFSGTTGASTSNTGTGAFGAFGQPASGSTNPAQGGVFGTGAFGGQQQPQPQPGVFGAFGQPQPQQPGTGGAFGGGAFGGNQQKPFGTFGSAGTGTTGAFSSGTGAFGTQPQSQTGVTGTGLFGQQAQPAQSAGGFGAFSGNTAQKPSIFGQPSQQSTGFGTFGNQQPPQQQGQPPQGTQPSGSIFGTGGLFGQQQQPQQSQQGMTQQAGGLFGTQATQQPQPATNLFGTGTSGGGSLFGNAANQQPGQSQPQTGGQAGGFGLFGTKPAAPTTATGGGVFGTGAFGQGSNAGTAASGQQASIFGAPLGQTGGAQANTTGFGGGLFGKSANAGMQQPVQQAGSLFGGGGGASLFGNTMGGNAALGQSTAQPQLTASIAQPISANLPIFSMLPPGPRAVNLEQPKKKSGLFVDVPTRSPVPRLQLGYSPASSKLRGFTSMTMIPGTDGRPLGPAMSLTSGKPGVLSLSKSSANRSFLGPDSFLGSVNGSGPGLGSGTRQSVKKLTLDKKIEPSDLFSKSTASSKVMFNPALSIAARELEAATASATAAGSESPQHAIKTQPAKTSNRFSAQASSEQGKEPSEKEIELQEGDYYVRPSLSDLKKRSFKELGETEGLVVGRVGYGEIEFLDKVDLTGLSKTSELLGDFIRFDDKECAVYPDCDEADKPPPGSGLNVRARITLLHCWPVDKATREPIKDEKHPAMIRHLKRLKVMKNTHFESYDNESGKWVFTVDHF